MKRRGILVVLGGSACGALAGGAWAGPVPRIVHTLHGTVLAVDTMAHNLTVRARRMESWMQAAQAIYQVDSEKLLREVKAGDQIMGKVFDGETTLHHVEIVAVAVLREP